MNPADYLHSCVTQYVFLDGELALSRLLQHGLQVQQPRNQGKPVINVGVYTAYSLFPRGAGLESALGKKRSDPIQISQDPV